MSEIVLYEQGSHRNVLLPEFDAGEGVPSNQHLIVDGKEAMLLDPGGTKVYTQVVASLPKFSKGAKIKWVFLSHQDPDIVAAINGWLITTDATALLSKLWHRFVPHFGSDRLVFHRVKPIPDEGERVRLGESELLILPAHYLHSTGNFHVYDPQSKILYTGDLGAALGQPGREVTDFDAHIPFMEGFHRRYMSSSRALKAWAEMVRGLDIEMIAPQHGAVFRGRELVDRFIDWCANLECGIDVNHHLFKIPA